MAQRRDFPGIFHDVQWLQAVAELLYFFQVISPQHLTGTIHSDHHSGRAVLDESKGGRLGGSGRVCAFHGHNFKWLGNHTVKKKYGLG